MISPYISEGSGLKPHLRKGRRAIQPEISPYISEGSGLKPAPSTSAPLRPLISPYISEGSGLKHGKGRGRLNRAPESPLTSVRGAD